MKTKILLFSLFILLVTQSCEIYEPYEEIDYIPPAIPSGVVVINGDNRVDIYWNNNREAIAMMEGICLLAPLHPTILLITMSTTENFITTQLPHTITTAMKVN